MSKEQQHRVRQDRAHFVAGSGGGRVWWIDAGGGGERVEAARSDVRIWAWVSARTLYGQLMAVQGGTGPLALAEALRLWRVAGREGRGAAVSYLDGVLRDVGRLRRAIEGGAVGCTPNHGFVYASAGPYPDKFVALKGDGLGCRTDVMAYGARRVTQVARTFGGGDTWCARLEAALEGGALGEWLESVAVDLEFLRSVAAEDDPVSVSELVRTLLPPSRRRLCAYLGGVEGEHWFAVVRSDTRYCSSACRQAAYRERKRDNETGG
jgi:hypothetical protein